MLIGILFKVNFWQCRTQRDNGDGQYKIMYKITNLKEKFAQTVKSLVKKLYQ